MGRTTPHSESLLLADYAERLTTIEGVGFYHGGDPVYTLAGIPGQWLEQCLERAA